MTLAQEEARVEAHSASLKKELGVRDLALTQILFIIGLTWIGVAGTLGSSHIVMWLLAIVLFYLPMTAVVIYLNQLMPLEGGLYQWAKLGFNPTVGFLLAWNLWLYVIVFTSEIGLQCATYLSYALGPGAAWMTSSTWFVALASALVLTLDDGGGDDRIVGGQVGAQHRRRVHAHHLRRADPAAFLGLATGHLRDFHPFRASLPEFTLYNLNILGKLGFGALGGFEYVAILAGETRAPASAVRRSVLIAAPAIAIMFILGTATVVAYRPGGPDRPHRTAAAGVAGRLRPVRHRRPAGHHRDPDDAGDAGGAGQRELHGGDATADGRRLGPPAAAWHSAACTHATGHRSTRSCSSPHRRSPLSLVSLIGVGQAEAFQLLFNAGGIFYALTYVVMFAIPIVGLRAVTPRPSRWLQAAALSGLLMTLLYVALSVFPIIKVASVSGFALKIVAVIVLMNLVGVGILVAARRRSQSVTDKGE